MQRATPILWLLFSAGGTLAALVYPVHLGLVGLAIPLGLVDPAMHESQRTLLAHPLTRLYLLAFVSLPLFHWAHRFRYTLYDGLQLKHLTPLIVALCYGTALVGTVLCAWMLWTV
jgi:fumarate reductase subunit D